LPSPAGLPFGALLIVNVSSDLLGFHDIDSYRLIVRGRHTMTATAVPEPTTLLLLGTCVLVLLGNYWVRFARRGCGKH
jgi:hypothetical protein